MCPSGPKVEPIDKYQESFLANLVSRSVKGIIHNFEELFDRVLATVLQFSFQSQAN